MSKTGYGNWKGPFKDAIKGVDYIDPCPSGTYLVRGYRRSDGVEVPAYCKRMDRKEPREKEKMHRSSNDKYYEGEASEPLEAVNKILNQLDYYDRGDIGFSDSSGRVISDSEFYKNGGDFYVTVTAYDHEYYVSGNVHRKNGKWVAGAETEEVEF